MTTVTCPLHESGKISPDQTAIIGRDLEVRYGELDPMVSGTAENIEKAGIGRGDKVGIFMNTGFHSICLILGLLRAGIISCPISTRLPKIAVREHLDLIGCNKLVAGKSMREGGVLEDIAVYDPESLVSSSLTLNRGRNDERIPIDQPATICFTSGSTGNPKAVMHTFGNHYYSALGANMNLRLRSGDRWLLSLPLYHVGGMAILFRCISSGAGIVVMEPGQPLEDAITRQGVTHLSVVSTQLYRLLDKNLPKDALKPLKAVLVGGGETPASLIDRAYANNLPVMPTYGLTEMNSQVTAMRPDSPPAKRYSAGVPLKYREIRILQDGEIQVKGQTLFEGYVRGSEIHCPLDKDGWFSTGDIGSMDEDGYLTVTGRKDNQFISGGENVHAEEIERVLCEIPEIRHAVVVPVPDKEFGRRPVAFLKCEYSALDTNSIIRELEKYLPRFKIPVDFLPWPDTDTDGIKLSREYLKSMAEELRA